MMETLKAIAKRKSTRGFADRQIPGEALETILDAGCAAPVGMRAYDSMHITVAQDAALIKRISDAASKAGPRPGADIYYGAPTVIIISAKTPPAAPGIEQANAACIAENMLLAATDLGIDNIYILGTLFAFQQEPDLLKAAGIPDGFAPAASVALGYAAQPSTEERDITKRGININRK
jgi:nitroreductase